MRRTARRVEQFNSLFEFLRRLEDANASFRLGRIRHESVLVEVYAPGEHWEVEFMEDGSLEIERFRSPGDIFDDRALPELWQLFTPPMGDRPAKQKTNQPRKKSQKTYGG
jgi:hypothetical protein